MYNLILTCENWAAIQWALRNGQPIVNEYNLTFAVKSNYKDRITVDDFLKQTGMTLRPQTGHPYEITNSNGWIIKCM